MKNLLEILEIITAVLLVVSILLQHRGTGIGGAFGGADISYRGRRGIEKLLFRGTILLATVFLVIVIAQILTN
ncbi:MAG TPA: preprotein translocase subunit SecG [Candidatus Saccharimonadales bacterium]|nr:preprotein translocase subunit SecG [Candidatus Saccharimonadales bacterium]